MPVTGWVSLIASLVAMLTSVIGLFLQNRQLKHQEKEFEEKYKSQESRVRDWLNSLPTEPFHDADRTEAGQPYQAGAPLRNAELFYGRQEQIESVLTNVNGPQMASISILGARRSGKTSFFYHLKHVVLSTDPLSRTVPVFLDAQNPISSDKNFYAYMLREASAALDARSKVKVRYPDVSKETDFEILSTFLEHASKKQWRFVFMLDEFERLMKETKISGEEFFASLRSLILKGNVSWITASSRVIYMPGTNTSPFINIIQENLYLGALSSTDARLLVSEPAARARHPFEPEDIDLILSLAGRMPYMIQKASLLLYKMRLSGMVGQPARSKLPDLLKENCVSYFKSQLAQLIPEEKKALFLLAFQKDVTDYSRVLKTLEEYGYVEKIAADFRVLGNIFEDYLRQQALEEGVS